jgi:ABC-type branched-subunit amino acid transport system ATPase component
MSVPAINLIDVAVHFGGVTALDHVTLDVEMGATHALIGPNGAGKSTLINVLTGIQKRYAGKVQIHGVDVTGWPAHQVPQLGLARTFQTVQLMPAATVRENVRVGGFLMSRASRMSLRSPVALGAGQLAPRMHPLAVDTVIDMLNLEALQQRLVGELPLGHLRLVELGRALMMQPSIIVLDEPASGMTDVEREAIMTLLSRIHRDLGVTMLIVEHQIEFLQGICQTATVLDQGRVIAGGTLSEVLRNRAVIDAYIGEAV